MKTIIFEVDDYINSQDLKNEVEKFIINSKNTQEVGNMFKYNFCENKQSCYGGSKPLSNEQIHQTSFWNRD